MFYHRKTLLRGILECLWLWQTIQRILHKTVNGSCAWIGHTVQTFLSASQSASLTMYAKKCCVKLLSRCFFCVRISKKETGISQECFFDFASSFYQQTHLPLLYSRIFEMLTLFTNFFLSWFPSIVWLDIKLSQEFLHDEDHKVDGMLFALFYIYHVTFYFSPIGMQCVKVLMIWMWRKTFSGESMLMGR